jgi:hypothetical protein
MVAIVFFKPRWMRRQTTRETLLKKGRRTLTLAVVGWLLCSVLRVLQHCAVARMGRLLTLPYATLPAHVQKFWPHLINRIVVLFAKLEQA